MQIVQLEIDNVKRIKAVRIKPDGNMVVIGGRNAQGKSSVLDAIEMALGGGKSIPKRPIRDGEEKARVVLDLEEYKVIRTFTAKGSYLAVESSEGHEIKSPQALLDSLVGSLSFDPLAFARAEPVKQRIELQRLVGLDFTEADDQKKELLENQRFLKRERQAKEDSLREAGRHEGVPDAEVSISELTTELERRNGETAENNKVREEAERARRDLRDLDAQKAKIEQQIASLVTESDELGEERAGAHAHADELAALVQGLQDPDVNEVRAQIETAEDTNRKVRENANFDTMTGQLERAQEQLDHAKAQIQTIDSDKRAAIAGAEFPVDGLGFSDGGVTFRDIPFDQCSTAEQIKVSMAMGLAVNPKLNIALIRDASHLDADSLTTVSDMAKAERAQVWIERVGAGDEVTVIIEDGEILQPGGSDNTYQHMPPAEDDSAVAGQQSVEGS